jgi:alpha-ketoglutarate-dependent taurine dioxygenase
MLFCSCGPWRPKAVQRRLTMTNAMLTRTITDRRAWTAATLDSPAAWYCPLTDRSLAALDESIRAQRRQPQPTTTVFLTPQQRARCGDDLLPARDALENGRGFIIIDRVPLDRYSRDEAQDLYWLVGQALGRPFEQNIQGTLLYDVRDTGQDLSKGARFSVTNYESSFHTDNSFGEEVLDYVGLLCLCAAKSGGQSQVQSGFAVHNELLARHRDCLRALYEPFHIERRGGVREGEGPTIRSPVIAWNGKDLLFRYLRYWIETGQQRAGLPLTVEQVNALDTLDAVMRRPELQAEFSLEPGQMFFINNRWILHNRTAFEDYPEIERRRHLVRLWLKRPELF